MSDPRTQEHEAAAEKLAFKIVAMQEGEGRAEEHLRLCRPGHPCSLRTIATLIAASLADAVRVAREEIEGLLLAAAKETCPLCQHGEPYYAATELPRMWIHHHPGVPIWNCSAPGLYDVLRALRSRVGDAAATAKPACCIHPARVDGPCPCECHVAARYRKGDATPGPDHAFIAYRGHVDLYDDPRCRTCGVNRSKHATPGPESFRPAPCFARAVDSAPERSPDPALLEAIKGSLKWATPPKKGTGR